MVVKHISEYKQIQAVLTPASQGTIVPFYKVAGEASHYVQAEVRDYDTHLNARVANLRCVTNVTSTKALILADSTFRDLETGHTLRIGGIRDGVEKKGVLIYHRFGNSDWEVIARLETFRASYYPFLNFNLAALIDAAGAFTLAEGAELGAAVEDVGTGYLLGDDRINIWGSVEETTVFTDFSPTPSSSITIEGSSSVSEFYLGQTAFAPFKNLGTMRLFGGYYWHQPNGEGVGHPSAFADHRSLALEKYYELMWQSPDVTVVGGKSLSASDDFWAQKALAIPAFNSVNAFPRMICTGVREGEF